MSYLRRSVGEPQWARSDPLLIRQTARTMKVAIPNFCTPDSFVDNVAFTLRAMGHEVYTRPSVPTSIAFSRVARRLLGLRDKIFPAVLPSHERWLLRLSKVTRLDLVLALTQSISEETLLEMKRRGVRARIAWWGDTPKNMQRMGLLTREWDAIFLKDRDTVEKYRSVGLNADFALEAMNPAWHRPLTGDAEDVVVIAGSMYGFRQFLVRELVGRGVPVALYGPPPPVWSNKEVASHHSRKYLVREEKSRVFGAGAACLNSSPETEGNSVNCRAFEIAGAGGLQLYEYRAAIEDCFEPGRELLVYHSLDELIDLVLRARRDRGLLQQVRDAAVRRSLAEHTYEHRLKVILRKAI